MWVVPYARSIAFAALLASDICALCLTVERYLAIVKPEFYRNLSTSLKRRIWSAVMIAALVISATRMHYAMAIGVEAAGDGYVYTVSQLGSTQFVVGLALFSDTIFPMALFLVMSALSTKFRMAVVKRFRMKTNI